MQQQLTQNERSKNRMAKYRCVSSCGYTYDPEKGEPKKGIEQGTPFEELPDDWVCPLCGIRKSIFKPVD
jgi:rubredoxin